MRLPGAGYLGWGIAWCKSAISSYLSFKPLISLYSTIVKNLKHQTKHILIFSKNCAGFSFKIVLPFILIRAEVALPGQAGRVG
jgi:hypothetical protein